MADVTDRPRSGRREGDAAVGAPLTHGREYADEELWTNYERFLEAVLPVAEEAGVEMCLHPDDPPVPSLGGVLWLFRSVDALKRAMELVPSDNHGLEFCLGTISEMGGEVTVLDAIDHFGSRDEITYVHFRDVEGTAPPVPRGVRERGELRRRRRRQRPRRRGVRGSSAPRPRPVRRGGAGVGVDRAGRTPSAAFRGCSTATTGPRDRRSTSALLETAAIRGPTHITPARGGRAVIRVA